MADFYSLRKEVEVAAARVEELRESAGLQKLEEELKSLEIKASDSAFWDDRAKAQEVLQAMTDIKDKLALFAELKTQVREILYFL